MDHNTIIATFRPSDRAAMQVVAARLDQMTKGVPENAVGLPKVDLYNLFVSRHGQVKTARFYLVCRLLEGIYSQYLKEGIVGADKVLELIRGLTIGDVMREMMHLKYWHSLDEALDNIETVREKNMVSDPRSTLSISCVVILTWYGASIKEMCALRKSDLDLDRGTVHVGGRPLFLNARSIALLSRLQKEERYVSFPPGKDTLFLDSPYLLRSGRIQQMKENTIAATMRRFNKYSDACGHRYIFEAVAVNGRYDRVYARICAGMSMASAMREEQGSCSDDYAAHFMDGYAVWKQAFGL